MIKLAPIVQEAENNNLEVRALKSPEEQALYRDYVQRHYLQNDSKTMLFKFGIFRKSDNQMIGIVTYGTPTDAQIYNRVMDLNGNKLFSNDAFIELARLWIRDDDMTHNAESQAISLGNQEITKLRPQTQVIVTYTDTSAGHTGVVYKATNAIEIGGSATKIRFFYAVGNPTTKKIVTKKLMYYKENYNKLRAMYNSNRRDMKTLNQMKLDITKEM